MLRLGVLDQSPVRSGGAVADAIHETLELAELCDRLGYHRYWLAEHHSTPGLAGSSPEVLIGQVAARTSRIRVGSGGVMLQHYSSLKVAESFRVLETLFPGRIDLGVGRAPGSDGLTAQALRDDGTPERFPQQVADLLGFLHGALPEGHPFAKVVAMPTGPTAIPRSPRPRPIRTPTASWRSGTTRAGAPWPARPSRCAHGSKRSPPTTKPTSWSSSRSPTTRRPGAGRTSSWPRCSSSRKPA